MRLSRRQLIDAARAATAVRRPLRFFLRQLYSRGEREYTLRSGVRIVVRDRTRDVAIMAEIFSRHCYDFPARGQRTVLDLGANIGLFTALAVSRLPEAEVECFEPDPENARLLRRMIALNGLGDRVRVVEACAGSRDGTVRFLGGRYSESRISDRGQLTIPVRNVLPFDADVVKIDIEGAEWELLHHPGFRDSRIGTLLLEWHVAGGGDEHAARTALADAGMRVVRVDTDPGSGVMCALGA